MMVVTIYNRFQNDEGLPVSEIKKTRLLDEKKKEWGVQCIIIVIISQ